MIDMTRNELIHKTAKATGYRQQDAAAIIEAAITIISDCLGSGEPLTVRGFGSLKLKRRPARMARNPRTGEEVLIPERNDICFDAAESLMKKVNEDA